MEKVGLIAVFDVSDFNRGLRQYLGGVKDANKAAESGEKSSFNFAHALEFAVGGALLEVGKLAGRAAGAMIGFGSDSIGVAAGFETQLAILQTAASSTGKTMDELGDIAIAVGADSRILGASASGAAEAMTGLFKSGLDTGAVFGDLNGFMNEGAELGGALRASFDLAAATTLSVAQAADLGVIALSTFGGELETGAQKSEFIGDALDYLVRAADASVAEVSDLGEALSFVGPSANDFGMSITDTTNALALFSTAGVTGSRAGTSLDAVLRDLKKGTNESSAALKQLGVEIYDVDTGATRPFIEILGDLEGALEGKTDAQKAAALQDIFTAQGMRGINTLLEQGTEGWYNMADATENAAGIQEQAALRTQTFEGQMEALDGQIETLQIQFGSALLPALTGFIEVIIPIIEKHMPLMESVFQAVGDVLKGLVDGFSNLAGGNFAEGIAGIGDIVGKVFGEKAKTTFVNMAIFLRENLPKAIQFLQSAFSTASTFIGAQSEKLGQFFENIQPIIEKIVTQSGQIWESFKENIGIIWMGIQNIISGALDFVLGIIQVGLSIARGEWDIAWQGIQQAAQGAWDFISGIIQTAFGLILTIVGTNAEQLFTTIAQLWIIIKTITSQVWQSISMFFINLWQGISTFVLTAVNNIVTFLSTAWQNISTTVMSAWESIKAFISTIIEGIKTVFIVAFGAIAALISGDTESAKQIISTAWEYIETFLSTTVENVKTAIVTAFETITTNVGTAIETLKFDAETKWENIKSSIKKVVDELKESIPKAWENIKKSVSEKIDSMLTAVSKKFADIKKEVSSRIEEIKTFLSQVDLAEIGSNIINSLASGIKSAAASVLSAIDDVVQGAIEGARNRLRMGSPSKVFASIGLNVMRGMSGGIEAGAMLPQQSLSSGIDNLVSSTVTNSNVTNINNSRTANVEINNSGGSGTDAVFYDVVGALGAVGIT